MALIYNSRDGDTVDEIAWRQYGVANGTVLDAVLAANPGLADYGPTLPAGVEINLPDIPQKSATTETVRLWS